MRKDARAKSNKPSSRVIIIAVLIVAAIVLLGAATVSSYVNSKLNKLEPMDLEASLEDFSDYNLSCVDVNGYINILVLGIDARDVENMDDLEEWRSDAIMIISIKESTGEVYLTSVYRDLMLLMGRESEFDKITHAFYRGGVQESIQSINQAFDLDIKNYILFNILSCADIVDAMGGIELDIEEYEINELNSVNEETADICGREEATKVDEPGLQLVDGTLAVSYGRIRYGVGDDYKRTERMRTVVETLLEKAKTLSLKDLDKVLDIALPEIKTNLNKSDVIGLSLKLMDLNVEGTTSFPFGISDGYIGGVSYVFPTSLYNDVATLHQEFFGQDNYEPTEKVEVLGNILYEYACSATSTPEGVPENWYEPDGYYESILYGDG